MEWSSSKLNISQEGTNELENKCEKKITQNAPCRNQEIEHGTKCQHKTNRSFKKIE